MRISLKDSAQRKSIGHKRVEGGQNDDDFFLRSVENGRTTIKVEILEGGHEAVMPASITLTIVDPFTILPAESHYILPTCTFEFQLALVKNQNSDEASLETIRNPGSKYDWQVDSADKALGTISQDGLFQSFNRPGRVTLRVYEKIFKNNTAETEINIVEAEKLELLMADVSTIYLKDGIQNSKTVASSFQEQLGVTAWSQNWIVV